MFVGLLNISESRDRPNIVSFQGTSPLGHVESVRLDVSSQDFQEDARLPLLSV